MENINRYIISQLKRPVDRHKLMAINNIVKILSVEELCSLYDEIAKITDDSNTYDWDAIHKVLRWVRCAAWDKMGGNKTITELVKLYKETGSKLAGDELCERFEHQSFEVQKCIFKTLIHTDYFLELYPYLNDTWGKILVDDLKQMWEDDITDIGVEYVIKFADKEFIWKHKDEFMQRHYDLVAMRLGNDPRFVVDRTKCGYKWVYYRVMQHLGEDVDREQLAKELFQAIALYTKDATRYPYIIEYHLDMLGDGCHISAQLIPDVKIAIREFCEMGLRDEVLLFHEWDTSIRQKVDKKIAERYDDSQYELSSSEMWMMYCNIARRNFPEKYAYMVAKDPRCIKRREEMLDELKPFIEQFGFEVEDDEEDIDVYEDESLSPTNDYIITMPSWDEVPF